MGVENLHIFKKEDCELRVKLAVELFKEGYNCSQSVVAAFADLYGYAKEDALRFSASFGGGIGRMRLTCGAACGMFMLAGLHCGAVVGSDRERKSANYKVVQALAAAFKDKCGSLTCAELLGLGTNTLKKISAQAERRTADYYQKRPCVRMVETAAQIYAAYLMNEASEYEDTVVG